MNRLSSFSSYPDVVDASVLLAPAAAGAGTGTSRIAAAHRLAAPAPQDSLDLGLPARPLLKLREAADALSVSLNHVRALIESGHLEAGHIGASATPRKQHLRVTRQSLISFRKARFGR